MVTVHWSLRPCRTAGQRWRVERLMRAWAGRHGTCPHVCSPGRPQAQRRAPRSTYCRTGRQTRDRMQPRRTSEPRGSLARPTRPRILGIMTGRRSFCCVRAVPLSGMGQATCHSRLLAQGAAGASSDEHQWGHVCRHANHASRRVVGAVGCKMGQPRLQEPGLSIIHRSSARCQCRRSR